MTLENMVEFITLAEMRNYQLAADRLFTTQATLSRHIMSMEEELGIVLFDRSHKRVELTDMGFRFLPYARRALDIRENYAADLARKLREVNGHLVIGFHRSSTYYNITDLLSEFSKEFPNIRISVTEAKTDALREMVRTNQCDFVFLREMKASHRTLDCITVNLDLLSVVLSADHPLACRGSVTLEDLKEEKFMLPPKNSTMYNIYMNIFQKHGINPNHSNIAGTSGRNISQFVEQGICAALYWKKNAEAIRGPGTVLLDITPPTHIYVNMLYKDDRASHAKNSFLQFVRSSVEQQNLTF